MQTQELSETRGGHPGLPVPNTPDGFSGCKATLTRKTNSGSHLKHTLDAFGLQLLGVQVTIHDVSRVDIDHNMVAAQAVQQR